MCVMCEMTGRDYYHTHNLPISEVTTINGVVQLEYPHILFGDLALWWRTTTREPGEIKYYLAKEGEIFDGVTAITPFDWQLEAITRVVNAINDRLRDNYIADCDLGVDFINTLKPKSYKMKGLKEGHLDYNRKHYGLIAQELIGTKLNDSIFGDKDGEYSLAYNDIIAPMIKAIQELSAKVETLENA